MNLEISNLYKIIVKVNDGSGILLKFEADKKCYILTAYHNIESSVDNNEPIELFSDNDKSYSIIGKPSNNIGSDFSLLEIKYIEKDIPIVTFERNIKPDDFITFMGYPDKANGDRKKLNGKIIEWNNKTAVNVIEENLHGSFVDKEKTNEVIVGFSGSGVFKKDGQKLSLIGILKSSPEEDFDYNEFSCVSIEKILQFIQDKNLLEATFSNPSASAFNQLKSNDERNLNDKLEVCTNIYPPQIKQFIRLASVGKEEQLLFSQRDISSIKYIIFEECQTELMSFVYKRKQLTFKRLEKLLDTYIDVAKRIIDDKRDEYNYGNFSDDMIKKIILDLIDTCYLSFDEEGIYE